MLKVAIIGCGKIADAHAAQVQRIKNCEIVAACDREELMAKQLCERFPIKAWFTDVGEMLEKARPDVVHITTPPQGHFPLGKQCLEHGAFTGDAGAVSRSSPGGASLSRAQGHKAARI